MKRKAKLGRRTLCTKANTEALCELLALPATIKTACEATGISESSFHDWIRRGQSGERPFSEFSQSVVRARGLGKVKLIRSILSGKDERVTLEYLSRVYPNEYGRSEPRVVLVERQPPPPPLPVAEAPPESRKRVRWLVADRDIFSASQIKYFTELRSASSGNGEEKR